MGRQGETKSNEGKKEGRLEDPARPASSMCFLSKKENERVSFSSVITPLQRLKKMRGRET